MQIKDRQKFLAIVAVAGLVLLLGDRLVLSPLKSNWTKRSAEIAELKKSIAQGSLLLQREQAIRQRWERMRTNTLPNDVSAAGSKMLTAFDHWARDSRVTIVSIKPQWRPTDDQYTTLECRGEATGTIEALSRFLYDMEQDPLGVKVQSLEVTARDDNGQQLALGFQISGLILNPAQQ